MNRAEAACYIVRTMPVLSAFADEISPDLGEEVRVLKECGIKCLDLRGFDGVNVMKLSDEQVKRAADSFKREGVSAVCIATPIGKVQVDDAFEPQMGQMKRALDLARTLGSKYIRLFSFYIPKGDDPKNWHKQVVERVGKLAKQAEGSGVTVVLENEEGLYGDTIERCAEVISAVKAPHLKLAFDPCNLVIVGPKPFPDSFFLVKKHLGYVHVKDWRAKTDEIVPAGEGDAQWREIAAGLKGMGYEGVMSLEPHLAMAGQFSGFSGADRFRKAHAAVVAIMNEAGLAID